MHPLEPTKVGVLLVTTTCASAGLSNAIQGLASVAIKANHPMKVVGFRGGPKGLLSGDPNTVLSVDGHSTVEDLGFGSWTDIPEVTKEALALVCAEHGLGALVFGCGVDELARTVALTEGLSLPDRDLAVYVVPHSRNCHNNHEVYYPTGSLGFDSATRALCEYVGNIAVDCLSSKKYWHFVRVGDPILTAHVALSVHVNAVVLPPSPETQATGFSFPTFLELVTSLQSLVVERAKHYGLRTGVVMISNLSVTAQYPDLHDLELVCAALEAPYRNELSAKKRFSPEQVQLLLLLPKDVRVHLLKTGKFQCSSPEILLAHAVRRLLLDDAVCPLMSKASLSIDFRAHYLGHESRSPPPTELDQRLGTALGVALGIRLTPGDRCLLAYNRDLFTSPEVESLRPDPISFVPFAEAKQARLLERRGFDVKHERLVELQTKIEASWKFSSVFSSVGPTALCADRVDSSTSAGGREVVERVLPLEPFPVRLPHRSIEAMSAVERARLDYVPDMLKLIDEGSNLHFELSAANDWPVDEKLFYSSTSVSRWVGMLTANEGVGAPQPAASSGRVGVVFLGSQAPGFHNVVWGLWRATAYFGNSELVGFMGGAMGLNEGYTVSLTDALISSYRNQGGQDMLGHFGGSVDYGKAVSTLNTLGLQGLVIVGGRKAAEDALEVNERLAGACTVVHVPASFGQDCDAITTTPVGFDTVAEVFGGILENLRRDAVAAGGGRRYFVAMAGDGNLAAAAVRSVGHSADFLVLGDPSGASRQRANLEEFVSAIEASAAPIVVIPESWTPQVEEFTRLLGEVDEVLERLNCKPDPWLQADLVQAQLSDESASLFKRLSRDTQLALVLGGTRHLESRELHFRNFAVEKILKALVREGDAVLCQSLNYQGRSSLPSNRDSDMGFLLGYTAGAALKAGATGISVFPAGKTPNDGVRGEPLLCLLKDEVDLDFADQCKELLELAAYSQESIDDVVELLERGLIMLNRGS